MMCTCNCYVVLSNFTNLLCEHIMRTTFISPQMQAWSSSEK